MKGYMQRSMRLLGKSGQPTVTDNIRVMESAQEITYRPVVKTLGLARESEEERVFALRTDPLRMELFNRKVCDEMRLDWKAPLAIANGVFEQGVKVAQEGAGLADSKKPADVVEV